MGGPAGLDYRLLFDFLPCFVTVQDDELRILAANNSFVREFGEFTGLKCHDLYKRRPEPCPACPVTRTFNDAQPHSNLEEVYGVNRGKMHVMVYTVPVKDERNRVTSVLHVAADVTKLMLLQERLQESGRKYHTLFEEVPCYISIQDKDLRLVERNKRFAEDFGEDTLGRKCYEVYKYRRSPCVPCPVQDTFKDGKVHRSEEVVTSLSGKQYNVLVYTEVFCLRSRVLREWARGMSSYPLQNVVM